MLKSCLLSSWWDLDKLHFSLQDSSKTVKCELTQPYVLCTTRVCENREYLYSYKWSYQDTQAFNCTAYLQRDSAVDYQWLRTEKRLNITACSLSGSYFRKPGVDRSYVSLYVWNPETISGNINKCNVIDTIYIWISQTLIIYVNSYIFIVKWAATTSCTTLFALALNYRVISWLARSTYCLYR
jgi:hypothetical protein